MECKTIIEELMQHPSAELEREMKLDNAYKLLSNGSWSAADAIFDEVLLDDPANKRALTGKHMISRELHVAERMARYNQRLAREQASNEWTKDMRPKFLREHKEPKLLRSNRARIALVAAFAVFCGAFGAVLVSSESEQQAVASEKPAAFVQYEPAHSDQFPPD